MSSFNKGILVYNHWFCLVGCNWSNLFWSVSFVGSIELVLHRAIWTALMLIDDYFFILINGKN